MNQEQYDALVAQAKTNAELTQAVLDAVKALNTTPPEEGEFTQAELDAVLAENSKFVEANNAFVAAITALKK